MPSRTESKLSGLTSTNFRSLSFGKWLFWVAGEVSEDAYDEGQFFDFDCATHLNVVSNLNSRRAHAIQFVLRTLSCHVVLPSWLKLATVLHPETPPFEGRR